jgi:Kef-type K+ transport system membrane component KefB
VSYASPAPVAPIAAHQLLVLLLQLGLLLLTALIVSGAVLRLKIPAVVGELCAGVVLGPSLLGHIAPGFENWLLPRDPSQFHLLDAISQIGLLLLVGLTGMHIDLNLVRRKAIGAAVISACGLLIPLGLGFASGLLLPAALFPGSTHRPVFALFVGVALCVSAIPVIAKTLMDLDLVHRDIGQLTLTVGMIDDAVGWLLLAVVSALATTEPGSGGLTKALIGLAGIALLAVLVGRPVVRATVRVLARSGEVRPTTAACVVVILFCAAATQSLGLEAAFGAFVAGIIIGSAGLRGPSVLAGFEPLVPAVLAPIFFASAGLRMDLASLSRPPVFASAVVLLTLAIAGKFGGAYAGARVSRLNRWEALALGAGMNSRGVVQIIIAMVGLRLGVLSADAYTIIVLIAVVTSLMAPPILRLAMSHVDCTAEEKSRQIQFAADDGREMVA